MLIDVMDGPSAGDDGTPQIAAVVATDESVQAVCTGLRQADVANLSRMPVVGTGGIEYIDSRLGVVVISQTCDIVQPSRPNVVVAKIVDADMETVEGAKEGKRPRFVHFTREGQDYFADLEYVATVSKAQLALAVVAGHSFDGDKKSARKFSLGVGRRFTRYPFPDHITPWVTPLRKEIQSKHSDPAKALGRALNVALQIRIESSGWDRSPMALSLHLILPRTTLPPFDEISDFTPTPELMKWLSDGRPPGEIADRLYPQGFDSEGLSAEDRHALWSALAESLASKCKPSNKDAKDLAVAGAVSTVTGQVWSEGEFTFDHFRRSEELDLDHLSPPTAS